MKIFLVEDSDMILGHLRRTVSEVPGAAVIAEAAGQDDAIAGIAAHCPDVVILDLALAAGSGIEVLRRIRPLHPALRIIVLTNKNAPQYRSKCLALGADLFLDKSRDFETLAQHLAALQTRR
ncbi:MAG TPA: response regulator transcription factor [Noviherbaspirillum sp.]|nr:response regulator transcription factor [Noviherbaspirillum sp.]